VVMASKECRWRVAQVYLKRWSGTEVPQWLEELVYLHGRYLTRPGTCIQGQSRLRLVVLMSTDCDSTIGMWDRFRVLK
jgi:hypothetical protein